ncbi:hypothetical protein D3C87_1609400 [compost metagenome]
MRHILIGHQIVQGFQSVGANLGFIHRQNRERLNVREVYALLAILPVNCRALAFHAILALEAETIEGVADQVKLAVVAHLKADFLRSAAKDLGYPQHIHIHG